MDLRPLNQLCLDTPRLQLRLPTEEELVALAHVAENGVHSPEQMPFLVPWTDPSDGFVEDFLTYHRHVRAGWDSEDWRLELGVFAGGEPVGVQSISAEHFAADRTAGTASWLALPRHGQGYGTEMRAAVLELAFTGLGATAAVSGAFEDNLASARVSTKLGYVKVGERWPRVRGVPVREHRFLIVPETFAAVDHAEVRIDGLDACRHLFGAV